MLKGEAFKVVYMQAPHFKYTLKVDTFIDLNKLFICVLLSIYGWRWVSQ